MDGENKDDDDHDQLTNQNSNRYICRQQTKMQVAALVESLSRVTLPERQHKQFPI